MVLRTQKPADSTTTEQAEVQVPVLLGGSFPPCPSTHTVPGEDGIHPQSGQHKNLSHLWVTLTLSLLQFSSSLYRSVMDPYAILALLGFLVFLFYIIYNFINNSGDGRSFGESSERIVNLFGDLISDSSSSCSEPSGKLSLT